MRGRERLLHTFRREPVDRIPVSPFIHVNYIKEFYGSHDVDVVLRTPEVYRHFGFDVMHRNCSIAYDSLGASGSVWQVETTLQKDGRDETKTTVIRTAHGDLRAVEATRWVYEYDAEASPVEYLVKSEADLDLLECYQPPCDPVDTSDLRRAREATGEDGITAPWIQGAFNLVAYYYRRVDDLLVDALQNPRFYHHLMNYCLERYLGFVQKLIDAGVDLLSAGGNIANAKMVGPTFFRRYIWPYEKRLIDFVQAQGVGLLYHNCGYARHLLPIYPTLGMNAYESLTPPPYGNTQLSEALDIFGRGTTLLGNLDQIDLLRKGSPAQIEEEVRRVLDTVRGRSHFILATTDYFNENTPHDNIHALAEAGLRWGRAGG